MIAADVHPGRAGLVRRASRRLGLTNLAVVVADGRHVPVRSGSFDRVLVDAPCSGLGVLRRRPEARWRLDPASMSELAELQRALVLAAAPAVAPGGTLVYSVCTLSAVETLAVAADILDALSDFEVIAPPPAPWRPHGPGGLLLPQDAGTDGMFVLGLRRSS